VANFLWLHLKKLDWILISSILLLCAIGSLVLFGIDAGEGTGNFFPRQILFIAMGLTAMLGLSFFDFRILKNNSVILIILYAFAFISLVAVLIFGVKIRGTFAWFRFGSFNFEPVEFAKIVLILILAKYFSSRHVEMYRIRHIVISVFWAGIPLILVLLQPDLGSALILVSIWLGVVILSGIKPRHLFIVLVSGILLSLMSWFFVLKPYQHQRILTYLNVAKDPLGYSYNSIQSKIAIGSGGFWGKGLGYGTQGQLDFLPEKQSDFIFAIFAEEFGLTGVLALFAVFLLFFWRLIKIIFNCNNNFFRLFISGFAVMIFGQIFINVGMNLGLLPITGISLPFISYGGSNLLINFIALGIIENIVTHSKKRLMAEMS